MKNKTIRGRVRVNEDETIIRGRDKPVDFFDILATGPFPLQKKKRNFHDYMHKQKFWGRVTMKNETIRGRVRMKMRQ